MKDDFGNRMKEYEAASDLRLPKRLPVIVRLDGNSFSKFTKSMNFEKPFDDNFFNVMSETTKALLEYCSGSQVGYFQSDEITLLLRNDQTIDTDPFLGNRVQKICSLLGSVASVSFNKNLYNQLNLKDIPIATFDCRVFVVSPNEVNNCFLWRQKDAFRNCVQGVAYYGLREKYGPKKSSKILHGQNNSQQQEIIFQELGMNINDYPTKYKRGACIIRESVVTPIEDLIGLEKARKLGKLGETVNRGIWSLDEEIPLFNQNTKYIEKFL